VFLSWKWKSRRLFELSTVKNGAAFFAAQTVTGQPGDRFVIEQPSM
jgi:hypothetical protein